MSAQPTLRLTRQERAAFFDGKRPSLTRDKEPACEKGDLYVLSWSRPKPYSQPAWCRRCNSQLPLNSQGKPKQFCDYCGSEAVEQAQTFRSHREPLYWLRVTRVKRSGTAEEWEILYELVDRRTPKRWLRKRPPARAVEPDTKALGASEIQAAAEQSAYQTTARGALDKQEAVDAETQAGFSKDASERDTELRRRRLEERRKLSLGARLRLVQRDAKARNVDITSKERVIERHLERVERQLIEQEAA